MKKLWIITLAAAVMLSGCASQQSRETTSGAANAGLQQDCVPPEGEHDIGYMTEIAIEDDLLAPGENADRSEQNLPPVMQLEAELGEVMMCANLDRGSYYWQSENGDRYENVSEPHNCAVATLLEKDRLTANPRLLLREGAEIYDFNRWDENGEKIPMKYGGDGTLYVFDELYEGVYCVDVKFPEGECEYLFRIGERKPATTDSPTNDTVSVPPSQSSAGCNPDDTAPVEQSEPHVVRLLVKHDGGSDYYDMVTGGFSWEVVMPDGTTSTMLTDCPAPYQMKLQPMFTAYPGEEVWAKLSCGELAAAYNWSEDGEKLSLKYSDVGIVLPAEPIGSVCSFVVECPHGVCEYVFAVEFEGELCGYPLAPATNGELTVYPAELFRVHDFDDGARANGEITEINSVEELKSYYNSNNGEAVGGFRFGSDFTDKLFNYDEQFFSENSLVIAYYREGSGSVQLTYKGVDEDGNIVIDRYMPECCIYDMAYYLLVMEVPQEIAGEFRK